MSLRTILAAVLLLSGLGTSCISATPPLSVRYFALPLPKIEARNSPGAARGKRLHLRRVSAAAHLEDRLIWSRGGPELHFADDRRWVESPAVYLERALEQHLFDGMGLLPSEALGVARLDVRLLTFEERLEPSHQARVEFAYELVGPDEACLMRVSQTAEEPVPTRNAEDFVRALSGALDRACAEAALEIANRLSVIPE